MQTVDCALCGVNDTLPYLAENGYQSVQCRRCGLVYCNPRPSMDEIKALYEGQETKIDLRKHISQRDYKSIQARRCLKQIRRLRKGGRLLEIGSAAGYFLLEAQKAGYDVQGIDITRPFVDFSERVLGVAAVEGTLMSVPFKSGTFDIIYHRNVLSHMANPRDEFTRMNDLLGRGGLMIFETGNVAELAPERAGELELPDHLYHFSEKTIHTLLDLTGFEHIRTQRYTLVTQFSAYRGIERRLGQWLSRSATTSPTAVAPVEEPLPTVLPASSGRERLGAHAAQILRYGIGALLPSRARRCSLVVTARQR